jgi:hypothetical protein
MLQLDIPARTLVRVRSLHGEIQLQVKIIRIASNITDLDQVALAIMSTSIMYMVIMGIIGRTLEMLRMGTGGMDTGGDIERSLRLKLSRNWWIWKMRRRIRGLMSSFTMLNSSGLVSNLFLRYISRADEVELEAILIVPDTPTLTQLDNTLRMFITFTGAYHGMYLTIHFESR